jgi:uncharacterized protein
MLEPGVSERFLIVDGHSIIFAWPELRAMHTRKTATARDHLIKTLTEYQDTTGINVIVVFDGKGKSVGKQHEPAGIQIFYSKSGHTADSVIERLVAKYAKIHSITVATSDLLEQQTAISFGAQCISAEGLYAIIADARRHLERELKRRNKS